jgi:hypothetical protein
MRAGSGLETIVCLPFEIHWSSECPCLVKLCFGICSVTRCKIMDFAACSLITSFTDSHQLSRKLIYEIDEKAMVLELVTSHRWFSCFCNFDLTPCNLDVIVVCACCRIEEVKSRRS